MIDGEGTICITRSRSDNRRVPAFTIRCNVSNTNLILLNWCLKVTGIGSIQPAYKKRAGSKQTYVWTLKREETAEFLPIILPYLQIKKSQAEKMLEFLATYSSGKLDEEILVLREVLADEISDLNRRGD